MGRSVSIIPSHLIIIFCRNLRRALYLLSEAKRLTVKGICRSNITLITLSSGEREGGGGNTRQVGQVYVFSKVWELLSIENQPQSRPNIHSS